MYRGPFIGSRSWPVPARSPPTPLSRCAAPCLSKPRAPARS